MRNRKPLVLVGVFCAIALLFAVGVGAAPQAKRFKFVHVAMGNYGDHWVQLVKGVQEAAAAFGNVEVTTMDAQLDKAKQVQLLENAITMKPDVIFLDHGTGEAMVPGVKKAMKAGIKVILFDVVVPGVDVTCDIAQDDYMLAYHSLQKLAQDIGGKGNIVVVSTSGSAPIERRKRILPLILDRYPGIKVVAEFGKTGANAVPQTIEMMDSVMTAHSGKNDIQAIWAPFDQWAIACLTAVQQRGREIPIYSIDVSPYDLELMRNPGSMWKATAACDPSEIGRVAVRVAELAMAGQPVPRYVIIPSALVTQEAARQIPAGKFITKDIVSEWGDSGIAWTPELKAMLKK